MGILRGLRLLRTLAVLGALSAVALAVGVGEVVTYLQNPAPRALLCAEAVQGAREGWVAIAGCRLRVAEAVQETWSDPSEIRKLYVPLEAPGQGEDARLGLVLATEDEGLIAKYRELLAAAQEVRGLQVNLELVKQDPGYAKFAKKAPAELQLDLVAAQARLHERAQAPDLSPVRDLEGMLEGQGWLDDAVMRDLQRELNPRLLPGFGLLADGATPRLAWPLTLTVLGLLFGLGFLGVLVAAFARPGRPGSETPAPSSSP